MEINQYCDNSKLYEHKAENEKKKIDYLKNKKSKNVQPKKLNHRKQSMHDLMEMIA